MTDDVRDALAAAQAARLALQRIDDEILPHKVVFQEATGELLRQRDMVVRVLGECEERLRTEAEAVFASTGNKHPVEGVTVKVFTRLEYDEAAAVGYAVEAAPHLVKLDRRQFEDFARQYPLDFVRSVQVPQATLAKDLGEPRAKPAGDDEW